MTTLEEELAEFHESLELARLDFAYTLQPAPLLFDRDGVKAPSNRELAAVRPVSLDDRTPEPRPVTDVNQQMVLTAWRPYP